MIKKLRIKFVCVVMAIALVLMSGILGVVLYFADENMERQSDSMLRTMASRPVPQEDFGKKPGKGGPVEVFTVEISSQGEVLSLSGLPEREQKDYLETIAAEALSTDKESGKIRRYGLRFLKMPSPLGTTIVFADMKMENDMMERMILICLGIYGVAMGAFLGISILLSRWMVKPVETAWEQQRQFVADASHELKTPLAVIMANAELLQGEETGEEERRQFSGNILTVSYQMRSLVESLLEVARVDNGAEQMQFVPVALSQLVEDAVLSFRLLYEEKGLVLESTVAEDINICGSEKHLYQVLDVLLDNAMKYSAADSTVSITLKTGGRNCLLSVSSEGEALTGEELKNIFKRFYRGDKARAMNGSYGLGLSIAESVVAAHNGKIWAESQPGRNTFHVQLPLHTKT